MSSGTPKKLPRKSISANVTPENSKQNSVSSLINKFRAVSEKRKDKQSAKEIKVRFFLTSTYYFVKWPVLVIESSEESVEER